VLPEAKAVTMDLFLARFAETLPAGVHAVLLLDQAGWHGKAALRVPDNVTLLPLPPYSPELNPVERVWLYLRERFLSFRLYHDEQAIVDALCAAWNALRAEMGRLTSLTGYPWLMHAIDQVNG
jgi:transposase